MDTKGSETAKLRVAGYLRTSTDEQCQSPEVQLGKLTVACEKAGWELVKVYYDVLSGVMPINRRPKFLELLQEASALGIRGVVAISSDRFVRALPVQYELEDLMLQHGLFAWGVDDRFQLGLPEGGQRLRAGQKAMQNVVGVMNEFYRDFISEKIRDHQASRVAKRLHHSGSPPFGYKPVKDAYNLDGKWYAGWVPDDTPDGSPDGMTIAERLRWIYARFLEKESLMDIAHTLTELGVPTPRLVQWNRLSEEERQRNIEKQQKRATAGRKIMALPPSRYWDSSVLSDMLRSKTYVGMHTYQSKEDKQRKAPRAWYLGHHEPLVTQDVFDQVQTILDAKGQQRRRPPVRRIEALLTGQMKCSCGRILTYRQKDPKRSRQYRYVCNMRKKTKGIACRFPGVNGGAVEQVAFELVRRGLRVRLAEIRAAAPRASASVEPGDLHAELVALDAKRRRILDNYEEGHYGQDAEGRAVRDSKLAPVLRRAEEIHAELAPKAPVGADDLDHALTNIEQHWDRWPTFVKRDILRTYVPRGFQMLDGRILRAEVCGVLLEAPVPVLEPHRPKGRCSPVLRVQTHESLPAKDRKACVGLSPDKGGQVGAAGPRSRKFTRLTTCWLSGQNGFVFSFSLSAMRSKWGDSQERLPGLGGLFSGARAIGSAY